MSETNAEPKLPWTITETVDRLELCHEHRWLRVIGFPLALLGIIATIAVWFIPQTNYAEAWPMLAVGSLIGVALTLLGLHLSYNKVTFTADRRAQQFIHNQGFGIFTRSVRLALNEIQSAILRSRTNAGSSLACYVLELVSDQRNILVAAFPDREPVAITAKRWSDFLEIPIEDLT